MSPWNRRVLIALVVLTGSLMVVPASLATHPGALVGSAAAPTPIAGTAGATAARILGPHASPAALASSMAAHDLAAAQAAHVPLSKIFLPNFNARTHIANGTVTPLYPTAPAPMGIGDFGVTDVNGTDVGSISYTSSVEGAFNLNSITPMYLDGAGPDQFTVQLNTVLTNVDLLGNLSNQFWTQNVPVYYAGSQTLAFEDNIWNFSSPSTAFNAASIYQHGPGGFIIPGLAYIGIGFSMHLPMPFSVRIYNNASVFNNRPTIWFNYSITTSNGTTIAGSYDYAEFNSSGSANATTAAPMPTFQINGVSAGDTNFLLNDAEIMLGGPGGGSQTNIYAINATMGLWTLPNATSTYQSVPAAWDFGTDTGETSAGIAEWWDGPAANPVVHLGGGPSLLYPLWGLVGSVSGHNSITVNLQPSNAFVFVAPGSTWNDSAAAWAPTSVTGTTTYNLPNGTWAWDFLLSERTPLFSTTTGNVSVTVRLHHNPAMGIYTPLWAWGNGQLAAISKSGNGTAANPYTLFNHGPTVMDPLFGEFSDYDFPVFAGIQLIDTSAWVNVIGEPAFSVAYTLPYEGGVVTSVGLPSTNYLEYNLYGVNHTAIVKDTISGWFWGAAAGELFGNLILWNSSQNLIAANQFDDMSTSLILYGGSHNTIWGNTFAATTPVASKPSTILYTGRQIGLWLFESGDVIYNNWFGVTFNAYTPTTDIYNGAPASYVDQWNVPVQNASNVRGWNGYALSGNILGLTWQGGNYWSDYGSQFSPYGYLPYNGGGLITNGGDHAPLTAQPVYLVLFQEYNLPAGTTWSVTFNGTTLSSTTSTIYAFDFNGTYAWTVGAVTGYTPSATSGAVTIAGVHQMVVIHWK